MRMGGWNYQNEIVNKFIQNPFPVYLQGLTSWEEFLGWHCWLPIE